MSTAPRRKIVLTGSNTDKQKVLREMFQAHQQSEAAPPPASPAPPVRQLEIGEAAPDGSIYAGISPDTGCRMYAMPADRKMQTIESAAADIASLNANNTLSHADWRLPTKAELDVLWKNRKKGALSGTFNLTGHATLGYYWSSTADGDREGWTQGFETGWQTKSLTNTYYSVRYVR